MLEIWRGGGEGWGGEDCLKWKVRKISNKKCMISEKRNVTYSV